MIIYIAIPNMIAQTPVPVQAIMISRNKVSLLSPNCDIIAVSKDKIETNADARLMTFAAIMTGLRYFLYLTRLMAAAIVA